MEGELKEVPLKGKVRKISRAYYLLIPSNIVKELDVKDSDEPIILLNRKDRVLAFRFTK